MDQAVGVEPVDLREYLSILRARKWTIILVAALVLGSALFFSFQQTPIYEAQTRLLVRGVPTDSSGYIQLPNLETEAEVIASEQIASMVAEDVGVEGTESLLQNLEVVQATETGQVLEITSASPVPQLARDTANSFAESYITFKQERAAEALEEGRVAIQARIDNVQARLNDLTERVNSPEVQRDPALLTTLETERSTLIARLGVLQQRLDDFQARVPLDLAGGEIIEPATLPLRASSPDHVRNGLLGGVIGLMLGTAMAFLRERLDDRLKGRMDAVRSLGAPVLASIPRMKIKKRKPYALALEADPQGHSSEAYRSLRTGIEFISGERSLESLLITSASPGEGKTMTAANVGVSLAQAGRRTILVSADLRRPTVEKYFGIEGGTGLAEWLTQENGLPIESVLQNPGIPNLRIMPTGRIPFNPAELLASPRLEELIQVLERNSDIVLFDSPPVLAVADPLILASRVGGTIVVLDAEKTHRSAAVHAKTELERVGASIIGSVLNSFDQSSAPYRYEAYSYSHPTQRNAAAGNGERKDSAEKKRSFGFRR